MLRANEPDDVTAAIPAEVLLDGERPLPEATEALIGACHIAFGFERTAAAVAAAFEPRIELASRDPDRLQVRPPGAPRPPRRPRRLRGDRRHRPAAPPHLRRRRDGRLEQVGTGEGRSKKAAEQVAAEQALRALGGEPAGRKWVLPGQNSVRGKEELGTMYLRSITMKGFKSFPERVSLEFSPASA